MTKAPALCVNDTDLSNQILKQGRYCQLTGMHELVPKRTIPSDNWNSALHVFHMHIICMNFKHTVMEFDHQMYSSRHVRATTQVV